MKKEQPSDGSSQLRQDFLKKHGIDPSQQQVLVFTLQQIQRAAVAKVDETAVYYLRKWEPELRNKKPEQFDARLRHWNAIFNATKADSDKLEGWQTLTYCYYRKSPEKKRAMEIRMRITPILGTANVRLDFEHKEIPFPSEIKIKEL